MADTDFENRDFDAEHEKFMLETIQRYKEEVERYSLEIDKGDDSASTYSLFFQAYKALYEFTKDDKKYRCVDKSIIDNICETYRAKTQKELNENKNIAYNYCHMADIYEYKKDNKKALEYYNMAVAEDESTLTSRAQFKNHVLNDRNGALADYNRALEIETDPKEREMIQHCIDNIDLIRNSDKLIRDTNIQIILIVIGVIAYILFQAYLTFTK